MSDIRDNLMETASSDDSHQLDPNLRSDLESLDDQIRSIIARLSARAAQSGRDETIFSYASSTVLLSIAATQTEKFSHLEGTIDIEAFLARANNAAVWVNNRRKRKSLVNTLSQGRVSEFDSGGSIAEACSMTRHAEGGRKIIN